MNDLLQIKQVWFRMSKWMFLWFKSDDCVANFLGQLSQKNVFGLITGSLFVLFGMNVTASPVTWRENSVPDGRLPLNNNEMLDSGSGSISIGSIDWTGTGMLGFGAGMLIGFGRGIWSRGKPTGELSETWLMWWLFWCVVDGKDSIRSNVMFPRSGIAFEWFKWLSSSTFESWSLKGSNEMTIFSVSFRFRDVFTNWESSSFLIWIFSWIRKCLVRLVFREKFLLQTLHRNGPVHKI